MSRPLPIRPLCSMLHPEAPRFGSSLTELNALSGPFTTLAKADWQRVSPLSQALSTLPAALASSLFMRLVLTPSPAALHSPNVSPP
jgi:hypothetical protein